jgi:hypothetical protein
MSFLFALSRTRSLLNEGKVEDEGVVKVEAKPAIEDEGVVQKTRRQHNTQPSKDTGARGDRLLFVGESWSAKANSFSVATGQAGTLQEN